MNVVKEEDAEGTVSIAGRYLYRDHHAKDGSTPRRSRVHSVDEDEELDPGQVLSGLVMASGLKDGDEFEVCITPTGKRPHGDRWFLFPSHRPEMDDEVLARIEGVDHVVGTTDTDVLLDMGRREKDGDEE